MVNTNTATPPKPRSIQPLIWVLIACLAPVVLALLAYYVPALGLRPDGNTNYGQLITPQRSLPAAQTLGLKTLDGQPFDMQSLKGKWVLLSADQGACPETCVTKLFILRNSHASQGKNVERLTRVWLVTDDAPISEQILEAYKGTIVLRADLAKLAGYLTPGTNAQGAAAALAKPMWIIDPIGNLMLEFPENSDPVSVRKDISKLIYNSRIG